MWIERVLISTDSRVCATMACVDEIGRSINVLIEVVYRSLTHILQAYHLHRWHGQIARSTACRRDVRDKQDWHLSYTDRAYLIVLLSAETVGPENPG